VQEKAGFIPNVFVTLPHRPDEFRAFFAYHDPLMLRDSGLTKAEREMIIVATSGANDCLYCIVAHGAILRIHAKNPYVGDQVAVNYREAEITERQKAMLEFALKVALRSAELVDADFEALRGHGFSTRTSGTSVGSRRFTRSPTAWRISSPCGPTTSSTCSAGSPESSDASP
jgi:uncharacterized peroxidase-related enzyme